MKKIFILSIVILAGNLAFSQEKSSFKPEDFKNDENYGFFNYWQVFYSFGSNPTSSVHLEDAFSPGFHALELRIGTQSTGR